MFRSMFGVVVVVLLTTEGLSAQTSRLCYGNASGEVFCQDADGSNPATIASASPFPVVAIAVNLVDGRVYWGRYDFTTTQIFRAKFDGSESPQFVVLMSEGLAQQLTVDSEAQQLYFVELDQFGGLKLWRADLDGANKSIVSTGIPDPNAVDIGTPCPVSGIPAVGNVGLAILIATIAAAGGWVISRRTGFERAA